MIGLGADERASLATLFTRAVDQGARLARAEVRLAKAIAADRGRKAAVPVALLAFTLLLAQASVTVLLVGILIWLAAMIGPIGAALIVALAGLALCGLIAKLAVAKLAAALSPSLTEAERP